MIRMLGKIKVLSIVVAMTAIVVLSCVPPEEETTAMEKKIFSVEEAFEMVAAENDIARTLYTKAIVGAGKKKGLSFHEDWEKEDIEAGPLPALFLRGISGDISKKGEVPLGLFLGSDFPIRKSNKFKGKQADLFAQMRKDSLPKYFFDEENKLYTAMFPDFASAMPCVTCHNDHPETSKSDWKLGDIQGATTWTYPSDSLTFGELQGIIMAYRKGALATFNKFIAETKDFKKNETPAIGDTWPGQGEYAIPTAEVFLDSVADLTAYNTLKAILKN